jgi:hypothetical protein
VDRDPRCAAAALAGPGLELVVSGWDEFLREHLAAAVSGAPPPADRRPTPAETDLLVVTAATPSHFLRWLAASLAPDVRLEEIEPPFAPDVDLVRAAGPRLALSLAEWPCPARCLEPALCPATRQPRAWEMSLALAAYARALRRSGVAPLLDFLGGRATHRAGGALTLPLADWTHAARRLRAALRGRDGVHFLAGTVSGCHGAVALLRAAPVRGSGGARPGVDQRSRVTRAIQVEGPGTSSSPM